MSTNQQMPVWIKEILKDNDITERDIIIEAALYADLSDEEFKEFEENAKSIRHNKCYKYEQCRSGVRFRVEF